MTQNTINYVIHDGNARGHNHIDWLNTVRSLILNRQQELKS